MSKIGEGAMRRKLLKSYIDAKEKSVADHFCKLSKLRIFIPK